MVRSGPAPRRPLRSRIFLITVAKFNSLITRQYGALFVKRKLNKMFLYREVTNPFREWGRGRRRGKNRSVSVRHASGAWIKMVKRKLMSVQLKNKQRRTKMLLSFCPNRSWFTRIQEGCEKKGSHSIFKWDLTLIYSVPVAEKSSKRDFQTFDTGRTRESSIEQHQTCTGWRGEVKDFPKTTLLRLHARVGQGLVKWLSIFNRQRRRSGQLVD